MADAKKMFRKKALAKLSSPEQLDVMMRLTSPAVWLAGVALAFIAVGGATWGFIGKVRDRASGPGILIHGGQLKSVISEWSGEVTEVLVEEGDTVEEGQVIARVSQERYRLLIENQRERIAEMNRNRQISSGLSQDNVELLRTQHARAERELARKQRLVDKQLAPDSVLLQKQRQIDQLEQAILNTGAQSVRGQSALADAERELARLQSEMEAQSQILSTARGRVVQVKQGRGSAVAPGIPIIDLEPFQEQIEAVFYVPSADGKKIEVGTEVRISPATVKPEEYGFIVGEITEVGSFPESQETLIKTLRNDVLARELSGSGASFQVRANLLVDETPSGFKWTSSLGPPEEVFSGTPIEAQITTRTRRPVQMIVPMIRSTLGI
ncbi:MAG: NHLP bacteriocin system secretion protein [Acidobacteriota bacterium]